MYTFETYKKKKNKETESLSKEIESFSSEWISVPIFQLWYCTVVLLNVTFGGKSTLAPSSGYKAPHSPPLISSQGGIREGQVGRQDIHHHWAVTRPLLQSAMPRLSPPRDHDEVTLLLPTGVVLKEARWRIRAFIMASRMPPLAPQHGGGHMGRSRETSYSFQQRGISEAFWGIRTPSPTQKWGDLSLSCVNRG